MGAAQRYYTSLLGNWSGRYTLEAPAWAGLNRVRLRGQLSTTLAEEGEAFRHTTTLSIWGMRLLETSETITVLEDGRSCRLDGVQCLAWRAPLPYRASCRIHEDAQGADYEVSLGPVHISQTARIQPGGLELRHELRHLVGTVLLRRG